MSGLAEVLQPIVQSPSSASLGIDLGCNTLLDCGSSDCFLETHLIQKFQLKPYDITPIPLRLFDGSTNTSITQAIDLPIRFPTGELQTVTFYVTGLDSSCAAVLGYNWLTRYNPTIDWVLGSITFKTSSDLETAPRPNLGPTPVTTPDPPRLCSALASPRISLINAAAFSRACSLEGSTCFQLNTTGPELCGKATLPVPSSEHLDKVKANVPKDYHDFADVFNKACADTLAPHRPYDLKINLEEGTSPLLGLSIHSRLPSFQLSKISLTSTWL